MSHPTEFNIFWNHKTSDIRSVFATKGSSAIEPPGLTKLLPDDEMEQEKNETIFNNNDNSMAFTPKQGEPLNANATEFNPNSHHPTIKIEGSWSMSLDEGALGNKGCISIHKSLKVDKKDTKKWYPFVAGFDNAQSLYYWIFKTIQLQSHFHLAIKCKLITMTSYTKQPSSNYPFTIEPFPGMLANVPIETDPAEIKRNAAIAMQSKLYPLVDEFVPGTAGFIINDNGERTPSSENNSPQKPLMFHEVKDDEEDQKEDCRQGILISMGFQRDLVKFIINKNPNENDISLLVELCIATCPDEIGIIQPQSDAFTPRKCQWKEVGNCWNIQPNQLQQNQQIHHGYNVYNASNIQSQINVDNGLMVSTPIAAKYIKHVDDATSNVPQTIASSSERVMDDEVNTLQANDINLDCKSNILHPESNETFENKSFVILNLEMRHQKTKEPLYGIMTIDFVEKNYKYQLVDLLTDRQMYQKWKIEAKNLPKAARDHSEYKAALIIDKNIKLSQTDLLQITNSNKRLKNVYKYKKNCDIDIKREIEVIKSYLNTWKIVDRDIKIKDMIPVLFLPGNMNAIRIDWVYFVRIPPFGYDIAIEFRYKAEGKYLEFKKVFLDLEEIKEQHKLLGDQNILETEQRFNLQPGHYERLLASKTPRSQQIEKTKACLQFDEELRTDDGGDIEAIKEENKKLRQENKKKDLIIKEMQAMNEVEHKGKEKEIKKKKRYLMVEQVDVKELQKYLGELQEILEEKDFVIRKNEKERDEILKDNKFYNMQYQKYRNKFESMERKMFMLKQEIQDLKRQVEENQDNRKGNEMRIINANKSGGYGWREV